MSATDQALAELAASRLRLQGILQPAPDAHGAGAPGSWHQALRWARVMAWQAVPPAWRAWGRLLLQPLGEAAAPLIRRHPASALMLSACTGAALVLARPWRWRAASWVGLAELAHLAGPVGQALFAWATTRPPSCQDSVLPTPPDDPHESAPSQSVPDA